jgi:hypothetical protein
VLAGRVSDVAVVILHVERLSLLEDVGRFGFQRYWSLEFVGDVDLGFLQVDRHEFDGVFGVCRHDENYPRPGKGGALSTRRAAPTRVSSPSRVVAIQANG